VPREPLEEREVLVLWDPAVHPVHPV
jgi:hypothetical protein